MQILVKGKPLTAEQFEEVKDLIVDFMNDSMNARRPGKATRLAAIESSILERLASKKMLGALEGSTS